MHGKQYCVQEALVSMKMGLGFFFVCFFFKGKEENLCAFLRDAKDNKSELRFHLGEAERWVGGGR